MSSDSCILSSSGPLRWCRVGPFRSQPFPHLYFFHQSLYLELFVVQLSLSNPEFSFPSSLSIKEATDESGNMLRYILDSDVLGLVVEVIHIGSNAGVSILFNLSQHMSDI